MNRNQVFMLGIVLLMLGFQLRAIESFTLNGPSSEFVASKLQAAEAEQPKSNPFVLAINQTPVAAKKHTISPPKWIGWVLISVGGVLILHSFAMSKPE